METLKKELEQVNWQIEDCQKEIMEIKSKLERHVEDITIERPFDPTWIQNDATKLTAVTTKYHNLISQQMFIQTVIKEVEA